jgi:hypothetical protein
MLIDIISDSRWRQEARNEYMQVVRDVAAFLYDHGWIDDMDKIIKACETLPLTRYCNIIKTPTPYIVFSSQDWYLQASYIGHFGCRRFTIGTGPAAHEGLTLAKTADHANEFFKDYFDAV